MKKYHQDLKHVLTNGTLRGDRTGTGTISVFGLQSRYDLTEGFPLVTTKKMAWRAIVSELLWMIEGSGDERRLCEILHGTRDASKTTIWTANANADYWKHRASYPGDLKRVYGVQWRHWRTPVDHGYREIDQLAVLLDGLQHDPWGRRHILTAWNPGELDDMALPPCHVMSQFYVNEKQDGLYLSCQMYQRSADMVLGVPFNIAIYSLLTHIIAQCCGMKPGEFVHVIGDAHIYENHLDAVNVQLQRQPKPAPRLNLTPGIIDIDKFTMDDITLVGYQHHPAISAAMAV